MIIKSIGMIICAIVVLSLGLRYMRNSDESKNADSEIVRILAIGNSFSEDAVEQYLWDLGKEVGKPMIIANMYIGGCPLSLHLKNIQENLPAYSYRKVQVNGEKVTIEEVSIATALDDEEWDFISMQQASDLSGIYSTYEESLPPFFSAVKSHVESSPKHKNRDVKFMFHSTWAYAKNSNHKGFKNYGRDQNTMYRAIVNATQLATTNLVNFNLIIPAGTAVQNGRSSRLGDSFNRDGYHLELKYGRLTAACTWFSALFSGNFKGLRQFDVRQTAYLPEGVSAFEGVVAKEAAYQASKNPFDVTDLSLLSQSDALVM